MMRLGSSDTMHRETCLKLPSVTVVVDTFRRPGTLKRLLDSLHGLNPVREIIILDNGSDSATRQLAQDSALPVRYVDPGCNLGCGGGVKRGLEEGLKDRNATHFWIFDDDAVAHPGALDALLRAMEESEADVAVPIILDENGKLGYFPGLLNFRAWRFVDKNRNIAQKDYLKACGPAPIPFSWAPWPSILITRRAIQETGFPREDFWFMGEDLEFTLRLTYKFKAVFVPTATCGHYPPVATDTSLARESHYLRFCLLLQNLSFITLHLPHARRALKHLPGNYLRFFRTFGVSKETWLDAMKTFWWGGIYGKTAGTEGYQAFKNRLRDLYNTSREAFEQKV
jgi:GT2 family glycosyltransferase